MRFLPSLTTFISLCECYKTCCTSVMGGTTPACCQNQVKPIPVQRFSIRSRVICVTCFWHLIVGGFQLLWFNQLAFQLSNVPSHLSPNHHHYTKLGASLFLSAMYLRSTFTEPTWYGIVRRICSWTCFCFFYFCKDVVLDISPLDSDPEEKNTTGFSSLPASTSRVTCLHSQPDGNLGQCQLVNPFNHKQPKEASSKENKLILLSSF